MSRRIPLRRLAAPIARFPGRLALVAALVCAVGGAGIIGFVADGGQGLLVGSRSSAAQTQDRFTASFGGDPLVVVFDARNAQAPYLEGNLKRLAALELALSHDSRVQSVLGPGSVAGSLEVFAERKVNDLSLEYANYVADIAYLSRVSQGQTDTAALAAQRTKDVTDIKDLFGLAAVKAVLDGDQARQQYQVAAGDRKLDAIERQAVAAAAKDDLPPLFAEFDATTRQVAGKPITVDQAQAHQDFALLTTAYGDCSALLAQALKRNPSCQVFFDHALLDLPHCPLVSAAGFCPAKSQWVGVLPASSSGAVAVVTVRLTADALKDPATARDVRARIGDLLQHGVSRDAHTVDLPDDSIRQLQSIGGLQPTECAGSSSATACRTQFGDNPIAWRVAGAPLLAEGIAGSTSRQLLLVLPAAAVVMLLLLLGGFRVRGRVMPLAAAGAAVLVTLGISVRLGVHVTPAVLAGVPVLVGLAVDYAVQLVARYTGERAEGGTVASALDRTLGDTGPATLVAALATLAGMLTLAVLAGVDAGPLVSVPLVAQFAVVLAGGIVVSWCAAVLIALPAAVWADRRRGPVAAAPREAMRPGGSRTSALSRRWRAVLAAAAVPALLGWLVLPRVPVQTDVEKLVAPQLSELTDIDATRALTGYANEVDLFIEGDVAGTATASTGAGVVWQCQEAASLRRDEAGAVAQATSFTDILVAAASSAAGGGGSPCGVLPAAPSGSGPTPGASPSASAGPSTGGTPTRGGPAVPGTGAPAVPGSSSSPSAVRDDGGVRLGTVHAATGVVAAALALVGAPVPAVATPAPTAPPTSAPTAPPTARPGITPAPSPTASPGPAGAPPQTAVLCSLRNLPLLSRTLVMPIDARSVQPCPPLDRVTGTQLSQDTTPIAPAVARIAIGVRSTAIADQAKLVAALDRDAAEAPGDVHVAPAGLAVLAVRAYTTISQRVVLLNLVPLLVVALLLFAIHREPRRALLPVLPTALAAGWAPLVVLLLGRLPGGVGEALGSLNPLTVVMGALVVALGTEFGVVLLHRFLEERRTGLDPDAAAAAAMAGVGRAIQVSAATLGAGFAVLALSILLPGGLPLVAGFGLTVVIDLALAVTAVFWVMLPLAVAWERRAPSQFAPVMEAAPARRAARPSLALDATVPAATGDAGHGEMLGRDQGEVAPPAAAPATGPPVRTQVSPPEPDTGAAGVAEPGARRAGPDAGATGTTSPAPPAARPSRRVGRTPGVSGRRAPATPLGDGPPAQAGHRRPGVIPRPRSAPLALPVEAAPEPDENDPAPPPGGGHAGDGATSKPEAATSPLRPAPRSRHRRRPPPWVRNQKDEPLAPPDD